jgi:hypothetical protein
MLQGLGTQSFVIIAPKTIHIAKLEHGSGPMVLMLLRRGVGTYTSNTQPNHDELGSFTPCPGEPNFAYAKNICAMIDPNLPAAADRP